MTLEKRKNSRVSFHLVYFICFFYFLLEDERLVAVFMNDTPALSATLESVLIRKPLAKHVLDLRVKSEMMTKNRFSDGFTGWSSPVGSSINNCVAIVVQKRRDVSNSAQGEGRRSSRRMWGAQDPRTT